LCRQLDREEKPALVSASGKQRVGSRTWQCCPSERLQSISSRRDTFERDMGEDDFVVSFRVIFVRAPFEDWADRVLTFHDPRNGGETDKQGGLFKLGELELVSFDSPGIRRD
jgi:hypothetical protein